MVSVPDSAAPGGDAGALADPAAAGGTLAREVTVLSELGFHMRPMQRFKEIAEEFKSEITVQRVDAPDGSAPLDGRSMFALMELAAAKGTKLILRADGPDAGAALDRLDAFFAKAFGE